MRIHLFKNSLKEVFLKLYLHRDLIISLTKKDIYSRYRGSYFGILWTLFNPIILLIIYTFVFGYIFNARWGSTSGTKSEFAIILFSGLIIFYFFSECVGRAPREIISNPNYVKKVIFPLEVLSVVSILNSMFHLMINFGVLLFCYLLVFESLNFTLLFFPFIFFPLFFITLGISWFFSSLGVYFRDLSQFVNLFITALMFLSPIFYSLDRIPISYQKFFFLNPLTFTIESFRNILIYGLMPDFYMLFLYYLISYIFMHLSYIWFIKTKTGFSDVL